jgi:SAM-dependent methyltransferase
MSKLSPFQNQVERYERWFSTNHWAYEAELRAVESLLPKEGLGVEVGVGTGRFASPLGVTFGVEPVLQMAQRAQNRGIKVLRGVAEKLPFQNGLFDFILMVTTICFVDDIHKTVQEAYRVLTVQGDLIVAFVDRESSLGQLYEKHKEESVFYKKATFYSIAELVGIMKQSGFKSFQFRQTLFDTAANITPEEPVSQGYGKGAFVVMRCGKTG